MDNRPIGIFDSGIGGSYGYERGYGAASIRKHNLFGRYCENTRTAPNPCRQ